MSTRAWVVGVGCTIGLWPSMAQATWSIVGVDPETQEVGIAVASCVPAPFGTTILPQVAGLVPGVGALAAQAQFSQQTRDQAVQLLARGHTPQEVIDMVNASDVGAASRQYGVVTLDGLAATWTGSSTLDWAGDLQGDLATAQGNILYGSDVVEDALATFEAETETCPFTLADRLMSALEAGAAKGGDSRCSEEQSARAAVLVVAAPRDPMNDPYIDLRIPSQPQDGDNPVVLLRASYDAWRLEHPPDDSACGGESSDTGSGDDTAGDASDAAESASTSGMSGDATGATSGGSLDATASITTSTDVDGTDATSPATNEDHAGCGCQTTSPIPTSATLLLLLAPWRLRRSRTTRR